MTNIDWSAHDQFSEDTCTCQCGATYRSHAKFSCSDGRPRIVSRKPCPGCGEQDGNVTASRSDPDSQVIA